MRRFWRRIALGLALILAILVIAPLVVPIPRLQGTVPVEELAAPDSRFIELSGLTIHAKQAGDGRRLFLLLHGFGASLFSWREVMAPLAQQGMVVAYDRPAFGLTERPLPGEWSGDSPYSPEAQAELVRDLIDELGFEQAVLVGNSAGGTIALLAALEYPERVEGLVLVNPAVHLSEPPGWITPLLRTPQLRRLGPLLVRAIDPLGPAMVKRAWHDSTLVTPEIIAGYELPLQADDWDQALWQLVVATGPLGLTERLDEVHQPVLVIASADDRFVPSEQNVQLAEELPNATLALLSDCGHVPQEECPDRFLEATTEFVEALPEK
jgi:pimeloyl-ACP methyl ester carboxylesterase